MCIDNNSDIFLYVEKCALLFLFYYYYDYDYDY